MAGCLSRLSKNSIKSKENIMATATAAPTINPTQTIPAPNLAFARLATNAQIERTVNSLEAHGIHAVVVENGRAARQKVAELLPEGAEVFTPLSATLAQTGIVEDIDNSGRYDSVRAKLVKMDRKTQGREMIKLGATPEYVIGSVHALTETGSALIASGTGSQLGSYGAGAAKVIWVVGSQKIVPTLEEGLRRVEEYSQPMESERLMKLYGVPASVSKLLVVNRDAPGRTTVIIVKENLGF
jgi:L-lactate utilization protein LutC